MRVLVTGAAGFIGGHLCEALLQRGDQVVGLDDFSSGKRENAQLLSKSPGFQLVEGSITDAQAVRRAVEGCELVFHLAAIPSVPLSVKEPERTFAVNVGGTQEVLSAARKAGVRRTVLACSCAAYGDGPEQPKREDLAPRPLSPYAAHKVACELLAQSATRALGQQAVALRFFNVYGPRQDPKSEYAAAIPRFATRLLSGQAPIVFGDGGQSRDFVFVGDVVRALLLASEAADAPGEVLNVASGRSVTLLELIEELKDVIGSEAKNLQVIHEPPRAGDLRASSADLTRIRAVLGYAPQVTLREGLSRVVACLRGA